jgi:imidazole glycerol-phosphate synthase subunit HisF
MRKIRIIPRLDIKGENLIKGVQLEGLRIIGDPNTYAQKYYKEGADELIYMDCVASLYGRNNLKDLVKKAAKNVFIPITVGGGIRSVEDAFELFRAGADKVAINTAAVKDPGLLKRLSEQFGSQSIVLSIEAKKIFKNSWEVFVENGREKTGVLVQDWVKKCTKLGIGEILVTSVDNEGMKKGFDIELLNQITELTNIPIIASGGMGNLNHFLSVANQSQVDAISVASVIHYNLIKLEEIRKFGLANNLNLREFYD